MKYFIILLILIINTQLFSENSTKQKKYAYVVEDNVQLFENPNYNANQLLILNATAFVFVLGSTNIIMQNGNYDTWIYVDSAQFESQLAEETNTIKGWLLKKYLAEDSDFKPIKKFDNLIITMIAPDVGYTYNIFYDGTYSYKSNDKIIKGQLYKYKNLLKLDSKAILYMDKDGNFKNIFAQVSVITNGKNNIEIQNNTYILTGDNVNVRAEAATNGVVLMKLSKGAKVTLLKRSDKEACRRRPFDRPRDRQEGILGVCGYRGNQ